MLGGVSKAQMALLATLIALLAAITTVLVTGRATRQESPSGSGSKLEGPTLPPGLRAANFVLTDQRGQPVSLAQYRGRIVVLTFIHSLCHDACPFMVEQIKGALNALAGGSAYVSALGISVAPREDTAINRNRFLAQHRMQGRLAFLNGPERVMRQIWHAYAIQPVQGKLDHSTFVLLIDRRGYERVGFPASGLTPEALAHDISALERERA